MSFDGFSPIPPGAMHLWGWTLQGKRATKIRQTLTPGACFGKDLSMSSSFSTYCFLSVYLLKIFGWSNMGQAC